MTPMTIRFDKNFGNTVAYPVCDVAKLFSLLVNKKTFSQHDLKIIGMLGFKVVIDHPVPKGWDMVET